MAAGEGTRIIGALEAAWTAIQRHHQDVPDIVVVTGSGRPRKGKYIKLGHYGAERWIAAAAEGRSPELFVAGETIAMGGQQVLQTMLHEAAHALAYVRGIKDTSSAGRWHNRRFATLAGELGLDAPQRAEPVLGFSSCTITAATVMRYAAAIRKLDAAALPYLEKPVPSGDGEDDGKGKDKGKGGSRAGKRVAATCGCTPTPRRMQLTPKVLAEGPIICGLCEQRFEAPEAEDDAPAEPGS